MFEQLWSKITVTLILLIVLGVIFSCRYTIVGVGEGEAYRMNRFTGRTWFVHPDGLRLLQKE